MLQKGIFAMPKSESELQSHIMAFNENTRVKVPAILHLTRLGYRYISLKDHVWDTNTNIFGAILPMPSQCHLKAL